MVLNFWSVILIASASQCVFLIFLLLTRPNNNQAAQKLLIGLLLVIVFMNTFNLWYAGRIYYSYPYMAGLGRGLSLLVGPLIYLYTSAITNPSFRLKWVQLCHGIPYLLVQVMLNLQQYPGGIDEGIAMVDSFMSQGIKATPIAIVRFVVYTLHLLTYAYFSRRLLSNLSENINYLISARRRKRWITQINVLLFVVAGILAMMIMNALITGYYGFYTNFWQTLAYSAFIYLLAYQAVANGRELLPDFNEKYGSVHLKEDHKTDLLPRLVRLFEEDKVFINAGLKLSDVANQLNSPPHVITSLINKELGKSFFELLNEYRVRQFIEWSKDPEFQHLSIMGIAQEVGYKSKSSFNTAFKKQTGQTPSEYLKSVD